MYEDVSKEPLSFESVAVGGTFDRLHVGHRLLLAATALVSTKHVYIGVTGVRVLSDLPVQHPWKAAQNVRRLMCLKDHPHCGLCKHTRVVVSTADSAPATAWSWHQGNSESDDMIAGQQLLQNKAHRELLESYEKRAQAASGYMKAVRPSLCIQTGALLDPKVCTVPCRAPSCFDDAPETSDDL